jgi:hypothetical protein
VLRGSRNRKNKPMTAFVDPRADPAPSTATVVGRKADTPDELTGLLGLCKEGRLYEVELWIREGRPLQVATAGGRANGRSVSTPLDIALETKNHALVLLLLCNGYDPNLEYHSPLDLALRARRWDLLDVLLDWGANPHQVDRADLFGTYRSDLFERFRDLGVDLTEGHEMADALAHHTSHKPLFGFAKRHRHHSPGIQGELNIALAHHAGEGNEKGVALCLWAGADPHAHADSLRYPHWQDASDDPEDDDDDDAFQGFSAIYEACHHGHVEILERLGPDPARDDFDELYRAARSGPVVGLLATLALPTNICEVIQSHLFWLSWNSDGWRSVEILRHLFEAGSRWDENSKEEIGHVRRGLLKTSDRTFIELMKLLATADYCSSDVRVELARTPSIRRRMEEVGFYPGPSDQRHHAVQPRPTKAREVLRKFDALPRKKNAPLPRLPATVQVGMRRPDSVKLSLDRTELFRLAWSTPMMKLAGDWGLSDRGLAKAFGRLRIPVPPRGFWAKVNAGKRVRRPRLPKLPQGEADEILVWVNE